MMESARTHHEHRGALQADFFVCRLFFVGRASKLDGQRRGCREETILEKLYALEGNLPCLGTVARRLRQRLREYFDGQVARSWKGRSTAIHEGRIRRYD